MACDPVRRLVFVPAAENCDLFTSHGSWSRVRSAFSIVAVRLAGSGGDRWGHPTSRWGTPNQDAHGRRSSGCCRRSSLSRRRRVKQHCMRFGQRRSGEEPWPLQETDGAIAERIKCRGWLRHRHWAGLSSAHPVRVLIENSVIRRDGQRPPLSFAGHSIGRSLRGSDGGSNPEASLTVLPGGRGAEACVRRSPSSLHVINDEDRIEGRKPKR